MSHYGFVVEQLMHSTEDERAHRRRRQTRVFRPERGEDRSSARKPSRSPGTSG